MPTPQATRNPTQTECDRYLSKAIEIVYDRCPNLVDPLEGLMEEADELLATIVIWLARCDRALN